MPSCAHRHRIDGICLACGHCAHELVLNRRCFFCGQLDVATTVKDSPAEAVVPAASLIRRSRGRE